jgi:hypothetical protein
MCRSTAIGFNHKACTGVYGISFRIIFSVVFFQSVTSNTLKGLVGLGLITTTIPPSMKKSLSGLRRIVALES